jgi:hypothetical protein
VHLRMTEFSQKTQLSRTITRFPLSEAKSTTFVRRSNEDSETPVLIQAQQTPHEKAPGGDCQSVRVTSTVKVIKTFSFSDGVVV